jgi:hypothetical protein
VQSPGEANAQQALAALHARMPCPCSRMHVLGLPLPPRTHKWT